MLSILAELTPEEKNTRNPLRQIPHGEPFPTPEDWQAFYNREGRQDTPAEAEPTHTERDPRQRLCRKEGCKGMSYYDHGFCDSCAMEAFLKSDDGLPEDITIDELYEFGSLEEADPLKLIGLPEVTYRVWKEGYNPYADSTMRSVGSALVCARFLMKEATNQVFVVFVVDGNEASRLPASNLI